ncbi:response regulator transcription factor [Dyadobacter sp. 676]|uniref:Response regulator transcription factor n=1 Tax=Dyadobacter sp. 676 TaxID=3088362 RepID=A0AAU8FIF5_9BACT
MKPFQKVLIADDHSIVRYGLRLLVQEVTGTNGAIDFARDGLEIRKLLQTNRYDFLILDINMPHSDGLTLVTEIISRSPEIRILVLSVNPEKAHAKRYLEAGAYGYVEKGESDEELRKAIVHIAGGQRYMSQAQMQLFSNMLFGKKYQNPFDQLSPREFAAAMLFLKGHGLAEVAETMHISVSTASTHKSRIFHKLAVENLLDLQKLAKLHSVLED